MKWLSTILVAVLACSVCSAQKHDNIWIQIYPFGFSPPYPALYFNFEKSNPLVLYSPVIFSGDGSQILISDFEGKPLFYSNGYSIYNIDGSLMPNGDSLSPILIQAQYPYGYPYWLSMLCLPRPGHNGDYFILQSYIENNWIYTPKILFSLIHGATSPGLGTVAFKNKLLFQGHNVIEYFNATKHANGQDWWVVFSDADTDNHTRTFYSYCLMADTAYQAISQVFPEYEPVPDHPWQISTFQKLFSPNGYFYINHDPIHGTRVHTFDRCTGELGPPILLPFQVGAQGETGLLAVSPNSQYLYTSNGDYIFQYDLTAPDIVATKDTVGIYDGYVEPPAGTPTVFGYPQLGPDGKIYYFIPGQDWVHVIAEPNKKGKACHVIQRAFKMPVQAGGVPFYPNYRLGPLDGSSCDTLGINNEPLADFWWFTDTTLQVRFSDNSFYEPALWHWNFGDGGMSQDTSPVHIFPAPGTYHVCLTVSNQYAADTICKEVTVGGMVPVLTPHFDTGIKVSISPNPAKNSMQVQLTGILTCESQLQIFDVLGKLQYTTSIHKDKQGIEISTQAFSDGIYYCRLTQDGKVLSASKFVVQH